MRSQQQLPAAAAHLKGIITYRQLDYWMRRGYLLPVHGRPGSGRAVQWSPAELDVAVRMARLVRMGLSPESAHAVARSPYWAAVALLLCACGVEKAPATPPQDAGAISAIPPRSTAAQSTLSFAENVPDASTTG